MFAEELDWIILFITLVSASVYWGRWRKNIANKIVDKLCQQHGFSPITSTARKRLYPNTKCFEKETKTYLVGFFLRGSLGSMVDIRLKSPLRSRFVILKISPTMHITSKSSPLTQLMMNDLIVVKTGNVTFDQKLKLYSEGSQLKHLLTLGVMKKLIEAATNDDFFLMTESTISSHAFHHQAIETVSKLTALIEEISRVSSKRPTHHHD